MLQHILELPLVDCFPFVELDDPEGEGSHHIADQVVVELLLAACSEAAVNRHCRLVIIL